jgi:hypothetical protein
MTFEHLNTIFHHVRGKHSSLLLFDIVSTILSLERYRRKKGVEVRFIAELKAFYGTYTYYRYANDILGRLSA